MLSTKKLTGKSIYVWIYVLYMISDCITINKALSNVRFINYFFKVAAISLALIFIYKFFLSKRPLRELLIFIFGLILLLLNSAKTSDLSFLTMFIILFSSYYITDREFLKLFIDTHLLEFIFCFATWIIFMIMGQDSFFYGSIPSELAEHKIAFGYVHPNQVAIRLGWTLIAVIIYKGVGLTSPKKWFYIFMSLILYFITKSATAIFTLLFIIMYNLKDKKSFEYIIANLSRHIYWILSLIVLSLIQNYNGLGPSFLQNLSLSINDFSSQRIAMGSEAIKQNGYTFFGQKLQSMATGFMSKNGHWYKTYTIDTPYIFFVISIGILCLITYCIVLYILCKKYKTVFHICVMIFALYSTSELTTIYLSSCFLIFYFRNVIFKDLTSNLWNNG